MAVVKSTPPPTKKINKKKIGRPAKIFQGIKISFTRFLEISDQWLYSFLSNCNFVDCD